MKRIQTLLVLTSFVLLACGGGSTDSTSNQNPPPGNNPPPPPPPAPVTRPSNTTCLAGDPVSYSAIRATNRFNNRSFSQPLGMIPRTGSNLLYIIERQGRVQAYDPVADTVSQFADISTNVDTTFEGGLLGMAFDPNFATNGYVYLSYTASSSTAALESRVSRFNTNATRTSVVNNSELVLIREDQPYANHNGGQIAFDSNGHLYIGFGDGGDANDTAQQGQDITTRLGAMLRIIPNTDANPSPLYTVPSGNPFSSNSTCSGGCPEIFAWGLRNPWRWSFDRSTNQLWVGDVGQSAREEIDLVQAGVNYGWGCFEGTLSNNNYQGSCSGVSNTAPVHEYGRSVGTSITGGYVYRGTQIPNLQGDYVFADYGNGQVFALSDPYTANPQRRTLLSTGRGIVSLAQDNNGELYIVDIFTGQILLLEPDPASGTTPPFATNLSDTGCADASDPRLPASGQIPYQINAPLWSDNADKQRWLALPDNTTISIDASHDWQLPAGTVLRKDFSINGTLVETRLLAHHNDGSWAGYSYEWNASQNEATLLSTGKTIIVGSQNWTFPSQAQCLQCHTSVANRALGPETAQINKPINDPNSTGQINQLDYFETLNLFSNYTGNPGSLPALPDYNDPLATPEAIARGYLHSNCSHCHQPGGTAQANINLHYAISLANTGLCNVAPSAGNVNGATLLLDPINKEPNSIIYQRMLTSSGNARMPPLAVSIEDSQGLQLLSNWINSFSICP